MRVTRNVLLLAFLALPAAAQVPPTLVASLGKQILQNLIFGTAKQELISGLAGAGCKGAALAGLAAAAEAGGGAGAARALTSGMRPSPSGGVGGVAMRGAGGGAPMGAMPPGMGGMGAMDPAMMQKMMEMMQQQNGSRMSPEQTAMMQNVMGQMQSSMSQPLSREETKAVFDDMAGLGLLTDKMRDEAKDCVTYAAPGTGDQIGSTGAVLKNMVLPAARQAKEQMASLTPEEQGQLADSMVETLSSASAADRKIFFDGFGLGFFPAPVVEQVRARVK